MALLWAGLAGQAGSASAPSPAAASAASSPAPSAMAAASSQTPAPALIAASAACPSPPKDASLLPGSAEACGAACCAAGEPLRLARPPESLPAATQGREYTQTIAAEGGRPPYRFTLVDGALPQGLALGSRGMITGLPEQPQVARFTVSVQDRAGAALQQAFNLQVRAAGARKPAAVASAPSAPSAPASDAVPFDPRTGLQAPSVPTALIYRLSGNAFDALKDHIAAAAVAAANAAASAASPAGDGLATDTVEPAAIVEPAMAAPPSPSSPSSPAEPASAPGRPAPPPPPVPSQLKWTDTQQAQLEAILAPMLEQDYLSALLFERAVRMRVCRQVAQLLVNDARRRNAQLPDVGERVSACLKEPEESAEAHDKTLAAAAKGELKPAQMRGWLLPPGLTAWLVAAARREEALVPPEKMLWRDEAGCSCAAPRDDNPLYAFLPFWKDAGTAQPIDFAFVNRLSVFALPLAGDLVLPKRWESDPDTTALLRAARSHGTRLDLTLYARNWRFITAPSPDEWKLARQQIPRQLAERAWGIIDTPLPGWWQTVKAWMPFFAERQYVGDGITLVVDELPTDAKELARFEDFYAAFVHALAEVMARHPERTYTINLVVPLPGMAALTKGGAAAPNEGGLAAFQVPALYELLAAVEQPELHNGRVVADLSDYRRRSNVELRFLVPLPEPTSDTKRQLRRIVEDSTVLHGTTRRAFLRSIVPVLQFPALDPQQLGDDLVYAQDNFGGVAFWPSPAAGHETHEALRATFGPEPPPAPMRVLCDWVCPNRWAVRLVLELLVLAGLVIWIALQLNCEWRRRYGRVALLAGLPPALVAFALATCDPAMAFLRNGTALLGALVVALAVFLVTALLKRTVEQP
ncbi:putative Ig domain-containing protein [Roseateles sp.]|uniref:putative Ig domain-containing protein n=1 Tax=Roseateles sp. TaxID=1971397 RepID=UPI0031D9F3E6